MYWSTILLIILLSNSIGDVISKVDNKVGMLPIKEKSCVTTMVDMKGEISFVVIKGFTCKELIMIDDSPPVEQKKI